MNKRLLVLENGKFYYGEGFGSLDTKTAEIVFNTSMLGYQEILSDPAYCGQMVLMTYPLIGNYGLTDDDYESKNICMAGFVVREYNDSPSNFRFTKTLSEVMADNGVVGISGIDTRELTQIIRDEGTMKAMITDASASVADCLLKMSSTPTTTGQVQRVSTKKTWYSRTRNPEFTVVAVDLGLKLSTVKRLNHWGCNLVVVPYDTSFEEVMRFKPDGLFLSGGPGNPHELTQTIDLVKKALGTLPILAIGLGHQIIALAYGAKVAKMKFGQHGANIPVKNLSNGKITVSSQNHCYMVDKDSIQECGLTLTHINMLDGHVEGMWDEKNNVMSMQFCPEDETSGECEDSVKQFSGLMKVAGGNGNAKENRY